MPILSHFPSGGTDTRDATAAAADIANGKTAYVNEQKVTGTSTKEYGPGDTISDNNFQPPDIVLRPANSIRVFQNLGKYTASGTSVANLFAYDSANDYLYNMGAKNSSDYCVSQYHTASGGSWVRDLVDLGPYFLRGLACDLSGNIYFLDNNANLWGFKPDGTQIFKNSSTGNSNPRALIYDPYANCLYVSGDNGTKKFSISGVVDSTFTCTLVPNAALTLAVDGAYLYLATSTAIYKINKLSGGTIGQVSVSSILYFCIDMNNGLLYAAANSSSAGALYVYNSNDLSQVTTSAQYSQITLILGIQVDPFGNLLVNYGNSILYKLTKRLGKIMWSATISSYVISPLFYLDDNGNALYGELNAFGEINTNWSITLS